MSTKRTRKPEPMFYVGSSSIRREGPNIHSTLESAIAEAKQKTVNDPDVDGGRYVVKVVARVEEVVQPVRVVKY